MHKETSQCKIRIQDRGIISATTTPYNNLGLKRPLEATGLIPCIQQRQLES